MEQSASLNYSYYNIHNPTRKPLSKILDAPPS